MLADVPLPTLLSQVLIAYTIEFDDVFEQRVPHFTTVGRYAGRGPQSVWLTSMAMWSDFMRHVSDDGITDLVVQIQGVPGGFARGQTTATDSGTLLDGRSIRGTGSVAIAP